jgi:kinesin family protein 5
VHVADLEEIQNSAGHDWVKQKIKDDKVSQMMNEHDIPELLEPTISIEMLQNENAELKKTVLNLTEESIESKHRVSSLEAKNQEALETLQTIRFEFEANLEQSIQQQKKNHGDKVDQVINDLKQKLDSQYNFKISVHQEEVKEARLAIDCKNAEITDLKTRFNHISQRNSELEDIISEMRNQAHHQTSDSPSVESLKLIIAQNSNDFEIMKQKLMRDLQNRCERVVELELNVEDTEKKLNALMSNKDLARQQEKLSILHKNLEHLMSIHKKLIQQNEGLKKEALVSERKLIAKEERISSLEELLNEFKSRKDSETFAYELTISTLKEKLTQAKKELTNEVSWLQSSKIAKPLRGMGSNDSVNTLSLSREIRSDKRRADGSGSWYLSLLKK